MISSVLVHHRSLHGGFVFDDTEAITNNKDVKPEVPWTRIFSDDFWGTPLSNPVSHKSYRPLATITYRLNVILSGFNPFHFHATNLASHAFTCVSFYLLIRQLSAKCQGRERISFVAGLLFTVHPVHTEAVCALVGRADLLCAFFFFASFSVYITCANLKSSSLFSHGIHLLLTFVFCCISMFCKEQGITVLIVCSAYDVLYASQNVVKVLFHCIVNVFRARPSVLDKNLNGLTMFVLRQVFLAFAVVVLFMARWRVMGSSLPEFKIVDNPSSFEPSVISRLLSYNYIYSLNLWLLLAPDWLCFDWSMGCIQPIKSVVDYRVPVVVLFWIFMGMWIKKGVKWISNEDGRLVLMSLCLVVIPFLPASNLFFRVGFVIAERVLYISVGGVALLVAYSVDRLPKKVYWVAVPLLVLTYSSKSYMRTLEWNEEKLLFYSALKVCPDNAKVHYNIAKNAADLGNADLAVEEYKEAIRLHPEYDQAMNNLANLLRDRNALTEAERLLERAVVIRPNFTAAWMNLGIVRASLKKYQLAEAAYFEALSLRKWYPDCYYNLGNLYLEQQDLEKAYKAFKNATTLQPTHALAWCNLIAMLDNAGKISEAMRLAEEALIHVPNEPNVHFTLANALGKGGLFSESESQFLEAIKLKPNNAVYYANLGVLYHRWKRFTDAETYYKLTLQVDPHFQSAKENLAILRKAASKKATRR